MIEMINLDEIKTSEVVSIPGWHGDSFECELKRPSLLTLAASGAIANPLMKTARRLFYSGVTTDGDLAEEGRVLIEIAKAAMVRPTYDELEKRGISLTDEQLIAVFQFTQLGARALERFRGFPGNHDGNSDGAEIPDKAE